MTEHIYFLGIGGTLMGSLAQLAKDLGFRVSGSDTALYPPMSDLLADAQIEVFDHFDPRQLSPAPDQIVIGNAGQHRGNPAIEYILDNGFNYVSGAEWLGNNILRDRWVLAVSGTHGKTTTASMLAWIFSANGKEPGFLIGGAPNNFDSSAKNGSGAYFIVEADEYDTSFFDRRSKFVHYRPKTLVINNIEYDHADIFASLREIQDQFHLLVRSLPGSGLIVVPQDDQNIKEVLDSGCWTSVQQINTGSEIDNVSGTTENSLHWACQGTASDFEVFEKGRLAGRVSWSMIGEHNRSNALCAIAASRHAGIAVSDACEALSSFQGVKRRLEVIYKSDLLTIYDDFAHHPSAIKKTLDGLRSHAPSDRIVAVIEPRTHTMSLGALQADLTLSTGSADLTHWFKGENIKWNLEQVAHNTLTPSLVSTSINELIELIEKESESKVRTHIVIMSNGAFDGIYKKLVTRLSH